MHSAGVLGRGSQPSWCSPCGASGRSTRLCPSASVVMHVDQNRARCPRPPPGQWGGASVASAGASVRGAAMASGPLFLGGGGVQTKLSWRSPLTSQYST